MRITKEEMVAATGTPNETGARLDWTLQCYAEMEVKHYAALREIRGLKAERDAYRNALENLMQFAHRLMGAENEDERGIGCCIAEGARVVENAR